MGFTPNAAKRALIQTKDNLEAATMWIMENMDNPNINDPVEEESSAAGFNAELIAKIMDLGFDETQAKIALIQNVHSKFIQKNNVEASLEWLFSMDGNVNDYLYLLNTASKKEAGPAGG